MEIAHLVSSAQLGGTESSVVAMLGSLRAHQPGWRLRVIAPQHGPLVDRVAAMQIPVDVLPFPRRLAQLGEAGRLGDAAGRARLALEIGASAAGAIAYARRLRGALGAPDVVHAHGFKMQVLSALARPRRARLVWHLHDYVSPRRASAPLLARLSPRCDVAIANSLSVAADARAVLGRSLRIETIYNAVEARFFDDGPAIDLDALAGAAPAPPGAVRVGLVATFGRWKGHETFLRALARLPHDLDVRGYIVGGASYQTAASQYTRAALLAMAEDLGLGTRVCFTGPIADMPAAYRALDVVVHASTQPEPFGMVIAEAMASGRALVISRAGGAVELVEDGVDGVAHEPGDAAALADRLLALARDPGYRRRLGAAARRTAAHRFDAARLGRELAPLYAPA